MASIQAAYRKYETAVKMYKLYDSFLRNEKGPAERKILQWLRSKWERKINGLHIHLLYIQKRKPPQKAVNQNKMSP